MSLLLSLGTGLAGWLTIGGMSNVTCRPLSPATVRLSYNINTVSVNNLFSYRLKLQRLYLSNHQYVKLHRRLASITTDAMADLGLVSGGDTYNFFFRKPSRNCNIRKRKSAASFSDEDDAAPSLPKPKKSAASDNKLLFFSARPSAPYAAASNSDTTLFRYASSTELQVNHDSRATATLETETDFSDDARAIRKRVLKRAEEVLKGKPNPGAAVPSSSTVYKGMNSYTDYKAGFRRELTVAGEKASGAHGPLRASAHIRMSTRFDYQPDICQDYKKTGYCGFGDACKFMHDRGDYKSGWQMDKEWEQKEKARKRNLRIKDEND